MQGVWSTHRGLAALAAAAFSSLLCSAVGVHAMFRPGLGDLRARLDASATRRVAMARLPHGEALCFWRSAGCLPQFRRTTVTLNVTMIEVAVPQQDIRLDTRTSR
jgi:hypothetical protein